MQEIQRAVLLPIFILLFGVSHSYAQQTEAKRNPDIGYLEAMELMSHNQFEAARKGFTDYLKYNTDDNSELHVNASYYQAFVTMELFHKDAEFLMEDFVLKHPESNWKNPAILNLGNYNFNRRDYDDALYWLNRLDERDLSSIQKEEVVFKKGFSAFQLEKFDEAKAEFYKLKDKQGAYYGPTNYYYGHIAYTEGNYQTALESLDKAADDPNFAPVVPYYKAQIYHFQEKYDELIAYATPLLDVEEPVRVEEIAHLVGDAHFQKEQYALALPFLEKYAKSQYNLSSEDAYQLAYAYYRSAEYRKSIDYFATTTKAEDQQLAQIATYQMADAYVQLGEKKYAQNAFKVASQMDSDRDVTEDALFNYAKLAYELSYDPFHEAIQAFESYLNKYPSSTRKDEAYEFLLKVHLATKNYSAAIESLNKMKSMSAVDRARYQECAYNLAIADVIAKRSNEAFANFKLSKKYPEDPKLVALADYWAGDLHYRDGSYQNAIKSYQAYLANSSAYQTKYYNTAHYNIGYCAFKDGDYSTSLQAFRKYVSGSNIDEKRKNDAYLRIGDLNLVQKQYGPAVESYQKAMNLNVANGDYALFQIAEAYGYQDNYAKKIETLNKLFADHPETSLAAVAKFQLGDAYFMQNNLDKALVSFDSVIKDYPQSPYRKKALLKRGLVQYRKGDYDGAIASYKLVVADYGVDSESNEAVATLKNIYLDLGKVDDYSAWLKEIPDYDISPSEIDSLSYQAAENLVADGNCDKAIPAFEKYLKEYPNGLFVLNANYYLSECAYRKNDFDKAITGFEYVASRPTSEFSEPAIQGAATIRFNRKEYQKALLLYKQLSQVATFATNILEAEVGIMRSEYQLGAYDAAVASAERVIKDPNVSEELLTESRLLKGRIYFTNGNYAEAKPIFSQLAKKADSKEGAEAKFRLAQIAFEQSDLDEAEKQIFELAQGFASFDFWKVKGFILLADVYVSRKDYFQARATLQSVIDNVKDEKFVNEAKAKLQALNAAEQKTIAAGDTLSGPDSLDYEEDYQNLIEEK
ncbi:tetratricopeptide repeat protein [Cryomorpha ignava]|uniref:Tetratricopeptide repeat protein n=1 Tax=Cryomorpha ignava TaxID=101383 RepID=A0A7K3WQ38_9FLAO|nr:tetratricopeptide repeat protein [Cryomorpha ignava]NEN22875.1 tetratricopeptide repeat protein [Cryomorpha ignava]